MCLLLAQLSGFYIPEIRRTWWFSLLNTKGEEVGHASGDAGQTALAISLWLANPKHLEKRCIYFIPLVLWARGFDSKTLFVLVKGT